jgi:hypothetical protein
MTPVKGIENDSSWAQLGWMKLLLIAYNVTHDVITLYYDYLNAETRSKNQIQHKWTKYCSCYYYSIRKFVEEKFRSLNLGLELADKLARNLGKIEYKGGKLGIWTLVKLWQLKWKNKENKNSVCPFKRKSHINDKSFPGIENSIYSLSTRYLNAAISLSIHLLRKAQLGQRNSSQKSYNMSQHSSSTSSHSSSSHYGKTP